MMPSLQKYVLHPLTALLLAAGLTQFIHHFQLIDVPYAATLSFLIVFASYLLLSKKYDPILSVICLFLALMLFYKVATIKPTAKPVHSPRKTAQTNLAVLMARAREHKILTGHEPQSLHQIGADLLQHSDFQMQLCTREANNCPEELRNFSSQAWIFTPVVLANDKLSEIWYISDSFDYYIKKDNGVLERIIP